MRIIEDAEIMQKSDREWPKPTRVGKQELEVLIGDKHKLFSTNKIGSFSEINNCKDSEGLTVFWYLV
jgi:protein mago nashi